MRVTIILATPPLKDWPSAVPLGPPRFNAAATYLVRLLSPGIAITASTDIDRFFCFGMPRQGKARARARARHADSVHCGEAEGQRGSFPTTPRGKGGASHREGRAKRAAGERRQSEDGRTMSRRGTSSGGGASSLGYLFGSDATALARPNNRAPPRHPQAAERSGPTDDPTMMMQQQHYAAYTAPRSRQQQYAHAGDLPTSGYATPTGFHTPAGPDYGRPSDYGPPDYGPPSPMLESNYRPSLPHQTRAAGKVINDGGGVSLDMSGGSMGRNNNYFRADGQNSGNFITDRPSTRVQAAPGGGSSLGYLFGGA